MNIGLGLAALPAYWNGRESAAREQYTQAKRDSELSLLPLETEKKKAQLGLDNLNIQREVGRADDINQAKDIQAKVGLSNAQADQVNQPEKQKIETNKLNYQRQVSDHELSGLADKLQQASVQGVLDRQGQSDAVLGTLGQLLTGYNKEGALKFANEIAKRGDVLPNTNGKVFTDITPVEKGSSIKSENGFIQAPEKGYTFVTEDGTNVFTPMSAFIGAMSKQKSGKYSLTHTPDGSLYTLNQNTGMVNQVAKGDPAYYTNKRTEREGPLQRDVNYLVNEHGMSKDQALAHLNSAKTTSREQFVLNAIKDKTANSYDYKPTQSDINNFGNLYDSVRKQHNAPLTSQGNGITKNPTAAPSNWQEWVPAGMP